MKSIYTDEQKAEIKKEQAIIRKFNRGEASEFERGHIDGTNGRIHTPDNTRPLKYTTAYNIGYNMGQRFFKRSA